MTKLRKRDVVADDLSPNASSSSFGSRMCRVWNIVVGFTRDVVAGPATSLEDCLEAFFDSSDLLGKFIDVYLQYCMYIEAFGSYILLWTICCLVINCFFFVVVVFVLGENRYLCQHCKRYKVF